MQFNINFFFKCLTVTLPMLYRHKIATNGKWFILIAFVTQIMTVSGGCRRTNISDRDITDSNLSNQSYDCVYQQNELAELTTTTPRNNYASKVLTFEDNRSIEGNPMSFDKRSDDEINSSKRSELSSLLSTQNNFVEDKKKLKLLYRKRRYLVFPEGSSFQMGKFLSDFFAFGS